LGGTDDAGNSESGHQANGADGKLGALQDGMVAKNIDFEAAPAKIDDAVGRRLRAESGGGGFPAEARFFFRCDDFQAKAGGLLDPADESATVAGFAGGAGGDGAIFGDAVFLHDFVEMAKCFDGFLENFFAEAVANENAFAEAEGKAFVDERFDIESGIGASDGQADGVGAGVDGGDVYRLGHELCYRQRWARAEEGVYLEARMPSCSPMRWRNCLLTAETLASPSSSMKALRLAMFSSSRLIIVW